MLTPEQKKSDCCGCMACSYACPKSAIAMAADETGFVYPEIDPKTCINCGICRKVCPLGENYTGTEAVPDIYAVQNHQKDVVLNSSSGGMFSLLADWVLAQDGVIYGVAFDDTFQVRHERADSHKSAAAFRTSKYVQSDPSRIYENICQDLSQGLTVLVTGTPCQIAGVNSFLTQKHADTSRYYTCDNICHGVPSPGVWTDYLNILKESYFSQEEQITSINMRSKRLSWKKHTMDLETTAGSREELMKEFSFDDIYHSNYPVRPSCANCHFTSFKRPSDFTLGDFWNVDSAGIKFDVTGGVNEVLVNTEKGKALFAQLKEKAAYQPVSKAAGWQPHLEYSAKAPGNRDAFWEEYIASAALADKEAILRKYMKGSTLTRIIRKVNPILQKTGLYSIAGKLYKTVFVKK